MSLHALIPPCAQTECDRFTGTIENRSTLTPSSASLIVQASPANPPPTTITRLFAAAMSKPLSYFGGADILVCLGWMYSSARSRISPQRLPQNRPLLQDELQ